MPRCLLLTQSGQRWLRIAAVQLDPLNPISSIANPCCNRVLFGVVPALVKAMRRRDFIKVIAGSAATWPLAARAQKSSSVRRVGVLMSTASDDPFGQANSAAFAQGLQQLGWEIGSNIRIDYRWGAGDIERFRKYAAELVGLSPDVRRHR